MKVCCTTIFTILALCMPIIGRADATPFKPDVHIHFIFTDGMKYAIIDSLYILHYKYAQEKPDTLYDSKENEDPYSEVNLSYYNQIIRLHGRQPYTFKVFMHMNNEWVESPWLYNYSLWADYRLTVTNNRLINSTRFFKTSWINYFIALFITIGSELFVLFIITAFGRLNKRIMTYWIIFNLISHPILWTLIVYTPINVLNGEWVVIGLESIGLILLCRKYISPVPAILLSIFLNGVSFIGGGILYMMFSVPC
ncbi:MAG TPA: hypothetical protein VD905_13445 [Flavobacteriales bacterium]|nr:hypothetical protein [Flavobacteriales bacterium]